MIKVYDNGNEFIKENDEFLKLEKYMSSLFYVDAKVLTNSTKSDYAVKALVDDKIMLGIRVMPYSLLLYGDNEALPEMIQYFDDNNYASEAVLCPETIGNELVKSHGYIKAIGMDFMETKDYTEESSSEVIKLKEEDLDELHSLILRFFIDCGLPDKPSKDKVKANLDNFRCIKVDGKIVSIGAYSGYTDTSCKITHVYTRDEYRGKSYARKVVNTMKNEIINSGMIATLNVYQNNPISNHLYKSLGFKKVYGQGMYKK